MLVSVLVLVLVLVLVGKLVVYLCFFKFLGVKVDSGGRGGNRKEGSLSEHSLERGKVRQGERKKEKGLILHKYLYKLSFTSYKPRQY